MNDKNYINNMFKENSIITRYGNHKIYSIDSIDFTMTPKSQLPRYHEKNKPTFIEYYKEHYKINIKEPNQPMIVVKVKKPQNEE